MKEDLVRRTEMANKTASNLFICIILFSMLFSLNSFAWLGKRIHHKLLQYLKNRENLFGLNRFNVHFIFLTKRRRQIFERKNMDPPYDVVNIVSRIHETTFLHNKQMIHFKSKQLYN